MTLNELLDALRELDTKLYSVEVDDFFVNATKDKADAIRTVEGLSENEAKLKAEKEILKPYISYRQEVAVLVGRLTNAVLVRIEEKLSQLSEELSDGIQDLQQKLDRLY